MHLYRPNCTLSVVNQIVDENVPPAVVATDPFDALDKELNTPTPHIKKPKELFAPTRANSMGWDLHHAGDLAKIEKSRIPFLRPQWKAEPLMATRFSGTAAKIVFNPSVPTVSNSL